MHTDCGLKCLRFILVGLTITGAGGSLHGQARTLAPRVVVLNLYFAAPGNRPQVLALRHRASQARRTLGLPEGRILVRTSDDSTLPDVIWEGEFPNEAAHEQDMAIRGASPAFEAIRDTMQSLIGRFERLLFTIEDAPFLSGGHASDDLVVVQNWYFAKPGLQSEVLAQRLHASRVREDLGVPRGRVLHRLTRGQDLPEVIWEAEYANLEARQREADWVGETAQFKVVMERMGTLLRLFVRGTWQVDPTPSSQRQ